MRRCFFVTNARHPVFFYVIPTKVGIFLSPPDAKVLLRWRSARRARWLESLFFYFVLSYHPVRCASTPPQEGNWELWNYIWWTQSNVCVQCFFSIFSKLKNGEIPPFFVFGFWRALGRTQTFVFVTVFSNQRGKKCGNFYYQCSSVYSQ